MCLTHRNLPRKSRFFLALGYLCVFSGIAILRLMQQNNDWRHFASGLLLGLAITFFFTATHKAHGDAKSA